MKVIAGAGVIFILWAIVMIFVSLGTRTYTEGGSSCDGNALVTKIIVAERNGDFVRVDRKVTPNSPLCAG